jgi:hypothetical protein
VCCAASYGVVVDAEHDGEVSFFAGAEMMTFLAPPSMWALALVAVGEVGRSTR